MRSSIALLAFCLPVSGASGQDRITPVREFDSACAKCHQQILSDYLATPMANASGAAVDGFAAATFRHKPSGVEYEVFLENGAAWLSYQRPGDEHLHGRQKLEFFMGSGNHGRTYLYSVNGYWFETPIAYYARKRGYDMRPAYLNDKEMPFNLPMNASCLRCHVSGTQKEDSGSRDHYAGLPFLHGGITCEACHGDSIAHVESGGAKAILNPSRLDPERRDSICISCHLEGDVAVPRRGRSPVDYRPGEKISDYVSYFVRAGAGTTNRAVSQVEALELSRCKRVTGDRMSCTTCHNPHRWVPAGERVAFYRAKCLTCHSAAKYSAAHFPEQPDCTQCHMPKGAPTDIPHEQWTDHRIRRTPNAPAFEPRLSADPGLIPVPGIQQQSNERDLALGYYNLVADGDLSQLTRAKTLLENAAKRDAGDIEVMKALGILAQMQNDRESAIQNYRAVLKENPSDYTSALNLGVLLARAGELREASELWQSAFSRNQDITELGMNLAAARCMLGDRTGAENVLQRVLIYNPDHQRARQELDEMRSGAESCPPK